MFLRGSSSEVCRIKLKKILQICYALTTNLPNKSARNSDKVTALFSVLRLLYWTMT